MIIIRIMGGLGNQMFQYAMYLKLKSMGKDVKGDTTTFYKLDLHRKYELSKFPNIKIEEATEEEKQHYMEMAKRWYHRAAGKLLLSKKKVRIFERLRYSEDIFGVKDAYVQGLWQSERYFEDISDEVRRNFVFPEIRDEENEKNLQNIISTNSVSVHIRRGDYLDNVNQRIYGNICTSFYYEKALEYFKRKYKNIVFFVFSDDIQWARDHIKAENVVYVNCNKGDNAIFDMLLMSKCRHNIIANSSFSWWGAWLNSNEDKEVIAPAKWLNTEKVEDIWCKGWIRLDG